MPKQNKLKVVSLFSGAGGLDLGAELAGMQVVFANDNDPNACATFRKNFPDVTCVEGDVKDIESFPDADVLIGGYPCQSFSLGGNRNPEKDGRTYLYLEFARALREIQPKYFIAENVSGLTGVKGGKFFEAQLNAFKDIGKFGYRISRQIVDAKDYGIPQTRRRVLLIGVRKDLNKAYIFPEKTHGKPTKKHPHLKPYTSHGDAIKDLPLWPEGDFYHRPHDKKNNFSWYFMSRNRKKPWDGPSYTVVANWRHITLHPAGPTMRLVWSDLENGWKQKWEFTDHYEHLEGDSTRPKLEKPRRFTWKECARLQTFPDDFIFVGNTEAKIRQIGNAVPPQLAKIFLKGLVDGTQLQDPPQDSVQLGIFE